ncbi:MAG: hypothetical protein COA32_15610 [Fluviicola sp.]|nr:MAG: hypothetical protein COA32_15610 [Fluviicola sp.]
MKPIFALLLIIFISNISFSQWNIQAGYDFGVFTTDYHESHLLSKKEDSHHLHRINGRLEYQFKNNFLISLNTGVNIHEVRSELQSLKNTNFSGNSVVRNRTSINHSILQTYRVGLSIGYNFSFNDISSIFFTLNYDHFFINKITNKQSSFITNYYSTSDVENDNPLYTVNEYRAMIDLDEIGYRNKFKKENSHIIFSLGYRHQIRNFFISPSLGWSPINNSFVDPILVVPLPQTMFLFSLNLGYTFNKKNNKNEK